MNLVFVLAVAVSMAALTRLGLPLLRLVMATLPGRSTTADGVGGSMAGAPHSESELEQSVRNRLYGERPKLITVTPLAADPGVRERGRR